MQPLPAAAGDREAHYAGCRDRGIAPRSSLCLAHSLLHTMPARNSTWCRLGIVLALSRSVCSQTVAMHGGPTCAQMTPFCVDASSRYNFEFSSNNNRQTTGTTDNWGCLGSHPGEQWMYITIDSAGSLAMHTSSAQDHDYAVWGPFASVATAMASCGHLGPPNDCSYSSSASEDVNVRSAQPGQVYIYLLTNYAQVTQSLTASLSPSNTAAVSCAAVQALIDECSDICDHVGQPAGSSNHAIHGGAQCSAMVPFCVDPQAHYNFEFSSNNNRQTTGTTDNWGCLSSHPGEQWMYITIDSAGSLAMHTSSAQDHDYAVWGPFASVAAARASCGHLGPPNDCSYSSSASEDVNVRSAQPGQVYIYLLTNYAQVTQSLTASLSPSNTAAVSCAAVDALLARCANFCSSSGGGGGPSPPPSGGSTGGSFQVMRGPCTTQRSGQCVGRPSGYGGSESCTISVRGQVTLGSCPIFNTEANYDQLTINGRSYDGNNCPSGIGMTASSVVTWHSDSSVSGNGWEICAAGSGTTTTACTSQSAQDSLMRSCCTNGATNCYLPTTCSSACAVSLPAFVSQCPTVLAAMGTLGPQMIRLANVCCANAATPACAALSGGSPPPPPVSGAVFTVTSGPCTLVNGGTCVGRPSGYGNSEQCQITANSAQVLGACPIFNTERSYDHLTIAGTNYDGTNCPRGIQIRAGSRIQWYADSSAVGGGWEICADLSGGGH
jgi:hypothetical protein